MIIAIVDSNKSQAEKLAVILKSAGHECHVFSLTGAFFEWLQPTQCDLLLLNSTVNDLEPAGVFLRLQQTSVKIPVLLLEESPDSEAIVPLLRAGLDDYCLLSPLRPAELLFRVQVLLRRAWPDRTASTQLKVGPFVFDTQAMSLKVEGRKIRLAQKEFDLALLLFQHLGQPVSRATILDAIWGVSTDVDPNFRSVDTHIARVRSKLRLRAEMGFRLTSVYGYGYVLEQLS